MKLVMINGLPFLSSDGVHPTITREQALQSALSRFLDSGKRLTLGGSRALAILAHGAQRYGNDSLALPCGPNRGNIYRGALQATLPFAYHLDRAQEIARRFDLNMPQRIALNLHDILEDTLMTLDLLQRCGASHYVLAIVDALTDGPGDTRKEQKLHSYRKIRQVIGADQVKMDDRIVNTKNCLLTGSERYWMYRDEYPQFKANIQDRQNQRAQSMWLYLDWLNSSVQNSLWRSNRNLYQGKLDGADFC